MKNAKHKCVTFILSGTTISKPIKIKRKKKKEGAHREENLI